MVSGGTLECVLFQSSGLSPGVLDPRVVVTDEPR